MDLPPAVRRGRSRATADASTANGSTSPTRARSAGGRCTLTPDLKGRRWVRVEAWDVAGNGAFSQPVWLFPPETVKGAKPAQ